MRCINCGWDNLPNARVCLKCGLPLTGSDNRSVNNQTQSAANSSNYEVAPKPTVLNVNNETETCRKTVVFHNETYINPECRKGIVECPKCHYPIAGGFTICPSCGTSIAYNTENNHRQTIRRPIKGTADSPDNKKPVCELTIIPEENENLVVEPMKYEGDTITLNRANTEPENRTITSKEQAEITFENGRWFLKNCSELNTTYIQVSRKIEIFPDDVIVLGDRRFKFNSNIIDTEGE